ncbi:glutamate ligase domain-containing protein [Homoserinimonas aerilata]|uniref:glutamate ligase domain-containing protein n=1 Tax=Homoserinimonas aerilata TaxID=1162970 RepID=UPI0011500FB7|nr:Mur ligase family protein [Homoserinimonas aerilata]
MGAEVPAAVTTVGMVGRASTNRMLHAAGVLPAVGPGGLLVLLARGRTRDDAVSSQSWSEALSGLDSSSVAVVTADEPRLVDLASASGARVVTFGFSELADVRATDIESSSQGTLFSAVLAGSSHRVRLALLGEHLVTSAIASLAAAHALGVPLGDAIEGLEALDATGTATMEPLRRPDGLLVIDDAASATAASTAAALKTLAVIGMEGRRTVAVLGELDGDGAASSVEEEDELNRELHDRIGRLVVRLNVKKLVVVGHDARHIHNAAGLEGSWDGESILVNGPEQAYDLLRDELDAGDVVLVKSSRDGGLQGLAARLASGPVQGVAS